MRRILVENARRKTSLKRGGGQTRQDLDRMAPAVETNAEELLALDEALTRLSQEDPAKAELIQLRYFAGLSVQQAADVMEISRATADRYWSYAKSWLLCCLRGDDPSTPSMENFPPE